MQQDDPPDPLARSGGTKRAAEGDPEGIRWRTGAEDGRRQEYEAKEQRLNLVEDLVDTLEEEAVQVHTGNGGVQMRICEEPLDLSFIATPEAELLEGALEITDVGGARSRLSDRVASCMMRSLCEATPSEIEDPSTEAAEAESIFGPGSKMGLEKGDSDYWRYDANNATWTRFIVVPRTSFFHPSEGAAEEKGCPGPKLLDLRNYRWTVADGIPPIQDAWKKDAGEMECNGSSVEWTGRVLFGEKWASAGMDGDAEEAILHAEMQVLEKIPKRGCSPPKFSAQ